MLKKISKLSLINILAQVISIIGFSINSKIYGAEIIGGLFVVLSYSSIVSILSSGYLEQAFFIEKNDNMYKYIFILILYLSFIVSLLTGLVLYITEVSYMIFIVLNIFSGSLLKTITSYNISKNNIFFISIAKLIFAPIIPFLYYLSYNFYGANESYIITISSMANALFSLIITVITLSVFNVKLISRDFFRVNLFVLIFKRYFDFVKYSMTGEFMRTFAFKAPTIALESFFGKEIAGFYGVANRILLMPIMVFVGTVSQIYMQKISSAYKEKKVMISFTIKILMILITAIIFGLGLYLFFGKQMLIMLLGFDFEPVYDVIIVLLPYAVSIVVFSPILNVYTVFEKQQNLFTMKLIVLICSVISFSISGMIKDFIFGLGIFSISLLFIYSFYGYKSYKIIQKHDKEVG